MSRALYCSLSVSMTRLSSAGVQFSSVIPRGMVPGSAAILISSRGAPTGEMQPMKHAMQKRRDDHAGDDEVEDPGEERVHAGEDLRGIGRKRVNRAHAAQDHRRVQEGVHWAQAGQAHVADYADQQR